MTPCRAPLVPLQCPSASRSLPGAVSAGAYTLRRPLRAVEAANNPSSTSTALVRRRRAEPGGQDPLAAVPSQASTAASSDRSPPACQRWPGILPKVDLFALSAVFPHRRGGAIGRLRYSSTIAVPTPEPEFQTIRAPRNSTPTSTGEAACPALDRRSGHQLTRGKSAYDRSVSMAVQLVGSQRDAELGALWLQVAERLRRMFHPRLIRQGPRR
jgi:hypothetical protein